MILIAIKKRERPDFPLNKFIFNFLLKNFVNLFLAICVTGGSGFLGQHLVKLLQERDDNCKEIRIVDLVSYTNHLGMLKLPSIQNNLFLYFKWNWTENNYFISFLVYQIVIFRYTFFVCLF